MKFRFKSNEKFLGTWLVILAFSFALLDSDAIRPVYAVDEDILMENIMEEILEEVREETRKEIKQEIQTETQEILAEETLQPTDSLLSGTYVSGGLTFQYVIVGFSYQVTGSNLSGTHQVTHSGTNEGVFTSFTITRIQITGPPSFFPANCTESGSGTGVFSGNGEPGTTHTIMVPALCFALMTTFVHTKI